MEQMDLNIVIQTMLLFLKKKLYNPIIQIHKYSKSYLQLKFGWHHSWVQFNHGWMRPRT